MDDPPVVSVGEVSPAKFDTSPAGFSVLLGCAGLAIASSFITPWLMSHCQPKDPLAIFVFAGFGTIAGGAFLVGSLLLLELPAWSKVLLSWAWGLLLVFSNVLGNRFAYGGSFSEGIVSGLYFVPGLCLVFQSPWFALKLFRNWHFAKEWSNARSFVIFDFVLFTTVVAVAVVSSKLGVETFLGRQEFNIPLWAGLSFLGLTALGIAAGYIFVAPSFFRSASKAALTILGTIGLLGAVAIGIALYTRMLGASSRNWVPAIGLFVSVASFASIVVGSMLGLRLTGRKLQTGFKLPVDSKESE